MIEIYSRGNRGHLERSQDSCHVKHTSGNVTEWKRPLGKSVFWEKKTRNAHFPEFRLLLIHRVFTKQIIIWRKNVRERKKNSVSSDWSVTKMWIVPTVLNSKPELSLELPILENTLKATVVSLHNFLLPFEQKRKGESQGQGQGWLAVIMTLGDPQAWKLTEPFPLKYWVWEIVLFDVVERKEFIPAFSKCLWV